MMTALKRKPEFNNVLLVTETEYLPTLLQLLKHAQTSVDIIAYSFSLASAAGRVSGVGAPYQIAEALMELKNKLKTKIQIRLYIEGKRETRDRNAITAELLKKSGVKIKYGSTHAKGFCIDGRYVLFGSTNLTNQSIMKNNETNLLMNEPKITKEFLAYFEHLWSGGKHGEIKLSLPLLADADFKPALLRLIDEAKKDLYFSIYFFHHTEIETALIKAHDRGVKVSGFIHDHASFAMSYVRRTRGTIERLRTAGIKNFRYGPNTLFTHSKYIIKDREELLLGTGNWLHEDVKIHPQLYIELYQPKIAKQLVAHLKSQMAPRQT